jgi:Flp pilus assembly protein TadD
MAAAGAAFETAVKLGPKDWTTHNNLGAYYLRGQKPKQAEQEFQTVLELAPDNTKAYNNLGATYLSIENYDKAIQMLQRSLSLDANNPAGFANLGNAYYRQQLYDDACRNYEKATSAANVQVSLWRSFGAACYFAPPEMKGKAKTAMDQALTKGVAALESNPKDPTLLADLADSHAVLALLDPSSSASHKAEARKLVSDAEKREPLTAEVMFMIASTHEELGDRQLALEWLARSVKAGKEMKDVERSPWLKNLRQDPQYVKQFR